MEVVNIHEAKTHLSRLIARALRGERIVIAKAGKPLVTLEVYEERAAPRRGGNWRGLVRLREDFDDPLPPEIAGPLGASQK